MVKVALAPTEAVYLPVAPCARTVPASGLGLPGATPPTATNVPVIVAIVSRVVDVGWERDEPEHAETVTNPAAAAHSNVLLTSGQRTSHHAATATECRVSATRASLSTPTARVRERTVFAMGLRRS
jgi:hypothetical protein